MTQIAAARTFTIYEDIEETAETRQNQGGSSTARSVIRGDKIISRKASL